MASVIVDQNFKVYCGDAVAAKITFSYPPGTVSGEESGLIISKKPGVLIQRFQPSESPGEDCKRYAARVTIARYRHTQPGQQGERIYGPDLTWSFSVYGPFSPELRIVSEPRGDSYHGIIQTVQVYCRSTFGYSYLGCTDPGWYTITSGAGYGSYILDPQQMRVHGISPLATPEQSFVFSVMDSTGLIYLRTESVEPSVLIECENCPPGTTRMGSCCLDCGGILSELAAMRSIVSQL
jgi:hypothetical protein